MTRTLVSVAGRIRETSRPHGITLGHNIAPQDWTIVMTDDEGGFELTGDVTGKDGRGNAFGPFTSDSGQIIIEPELWRRAERNRTGDRFTFNVKRSVRSKIDFSADSKTRFRVRIAQGLTNARHTLQLVPEGSADVNLEYLQAFRPPGK